MSYAEYRDQKDYDDIIEKQLTAERIKTEEHLADINEQLRDLIGSRVRASTGLQALNKLVFPTKFPFICFFFIYQVPLFLKIT